MLKTSEIEQIYQLQIENKKEFFPRSIEWRKEKLKKLLHIIIKEKDQILLALRADLGKSFTESQLIEVYPTVTDIKHTLRNLKKWAKPQRVKTPLTLFGSRSKIIKEAKGVSLIISPWNYPFLLSLNPIIHAVAAGNNIILKPSEISSNTSALLKNLLAKVFDEKEVAVVEGDYKTAQYLLGLKFDHIFFTGSPAIGKIVMEAASKNLTSVTLELGGKSPAIVDGTFDVELTARRIAWGKLINAGQTCIAPDYVLVKEEYENTLTELIQKQFINLYRAENGFFNSSDYPRIISERHTERLRLLIENEKQCGSVIYYGGEVKLNEKYVEPTIIKNVKADNSIMQEEIFGPILPIVSYRTKDEAIEIINQNANPLAMYLFSKDKRFVSEIIARCPSGGVTINDTILHFANVHLPFGGIGNSGIGKSHGKVGFDEFTNHRAVLKQSKFSPVSLLYPPYDSWKQKLSDILLKYF